MQHTSNVSDLDVPKHGSANSALTKNNHSGKNQGRPLLLMRISDDFCTSLIKAGAKFLAESSNFGSVYNIYCQCFSSGIVLVDLVDFPIKSTPVHF
jgi:thiamine kinase-like enzyme